MKLAELNLAEWDKSFKSVADLGDFEVLQLNLAKITGLNVAGRQNLVAIDKGNNIKWVAELPEGNYGYGYFNSFSYKGRKLKGWYGGSIFIEIDIQTGKIVKEDGVN
jgi:hypothetical protein